MTFSSEQIQRARELAKGRSKHGAIQRLLIDEFSLRPAQCRALLITALADEKAAQSILEQDCRIVLAPIGVSNDNPCNASIKRTLLTIGLRTCALKLR